MQNIHGQTDRQADRQTDIYNGYKIKIETWNGRRANCPSIWGGDSRTARDDNRIFHLLGLI